MTRLHPRDERDVAEAIGAALARHEPLEILSGGTRRDQGAPVAAGTILDLSGLAGIIDYEPAELTLTARPGTPMTVIAQTLAGQGQCLAFEPGASPGATLGGALASGDSGSRRPFAGAARDHFLGFRAVSGRGEAFKAGGKVVKNVTGYDLPKLMAGSFGTLAVLTEVTVKVMPAPEATETLGLTVGDPGAGLDLARTIAQGPFEATGLAVAPDRPGGPWRVLVRLEGTAISVGARRAALIAAHGGESLDASPWAALGTGLDLAAAPILWRISVAPDRAPDLGRALPGALVFDWAGARIFWSGTDATDGGAALLARHLGTGHAVLIRAPRALRETRAHVRPAAPALAALNRRIKGQFDPGSVLNPGRLGDWT